MLGFFKKDIENDAYDMIDNVKEDSTSTAYGCVTSISSVKLFVLSLTLYSHYWWMKGMIFPYQRKEKRKGGRETILQSQILSIFLLLLLTIFFE